ncbi:MAG TPA: FAD-binding oxidoreductase [Ilumatobacter sp.]|nr:FAD-binding oxidoreductase [Ilumatobacter sp.]
MTANTSLDTSLDAGIDTIDITDRAATAAALRGAANGHVYVPGDTEYDQYRVAWNVAFEQRPAAVAVPHTAAEAATVVRLAAELGLKVAPQSTGHNVGPLAQRGLDDVVLMRTQALDSVHIDAERRVARVGGGALWLPAVEAAADHGLATLHGSSPDVGIAGYSLGGGIGWYARKLGMATNSLTAVELVTGEGELVRADATQNEALFWALRGGGGNFGVVTALEFQLYPIETAYAGMFVWDIAHAERVLREYADWSPTAPHEISSSFRIMRFPPIPEIPEPFRGRQLVVVNGAVLGPDEFAERVVARFRALQPELDTWARVPARSLSRLHMDPEGNTPAISATTMLADLPGAAVDALLDVVGPDAQTSLLIAELRQLGGALAHRHPAGGALTKLDAAMLAFGVAMTPTPEAVAQAHVDAGRYTDALQPWSSAASYLNFVEERCDTKCGYTADAWEQLTAIRSAIDPGDVFVANHRIPRLFEQGRRTS